MTALRFLAGVATALATSTPAPAPAEPAEAAPCRLEWRANSGRDHDLNDGCLPALSVDGRRLAVARIESGSFTVLVLSVPGKGRELRSFHAHDVSDAPAVAKTVREVNAVLEREGLVRRYAYASRLRQAHQCWLHADLGRMRELLDAHLAPGWTERVEDPATWAPVIDIPASISDAALQKLLTPGVTFVRADWAVKAPQPKTFYGPRRYQLTARIQF
jgi:hypothetical protein